MSARLEDLRAEDPHSKHFPITMIPRIIHQIWTHGEVPKAYRHWQDSWQEMHPDFEYRLWSGLDIEKLINDSFAQWATLFYSYKENICRLDLARYLILQKFGGLYVDIDFQCLRPHHALLQKHSLLMGLEPQSHGLSSKARTSGLEKVVCNAWIASTADHPFWSHLLQDLERAAGATDVMELTGPWVLTRSIARYKGPSVAIVDPRHVYPADKEACWKGDIQDLEYYDSVTSGALAVHHWAGSWFRPQQHLRSLALPRAKVGLRPNSPAPSVPAPMSTSGAMSSEFSISCLMVTRGDPHRVRHSIAGFLAQTHQKTELVVVTDVHPSRLAMVRAEYPHKNIQWVFVEPSTLTLGELRNKSLDAATGDYVSQWDDDDLHDPSRLQHQLAALMAAKAHAIMLSRWTVWWPAKRRLFISSRRTWEGSLLCERRLMPRYPAMTKGEDTPVINAVLGSLKVAMMDAPRLYTYVVHGQNTWHDLHFEEIFRRATADFSGPKYTRMLREVARRVDVDGYYSKTHRYPSLTRVRANQAQDENSSNGSVLILTPMRNTRKHLDRYFELVNRLQYPKELLSIGILEGDSTDGTLEALLSLKQHWKNHYADIQIHKLDTGLHWTGPRWQPSLQLARRANLAVVRNTLLNRCLKDHDWVLWIDADVIDYSPDLVVRMLEGKKDIVAACCLKPDGSVFDQNTFIFHPDRTASERPEYILDGLYQPATGQGRRFLDSSKEPWERVDSVGGTALLVRGDLHRRGLHFPAYSYRGYIETEGLAAMAHDMGVQCWGARDIKVLHVNE